MKINVILIILMVNLGYSQQQNENWILKINTIQLIDIFSFPTLQISAEKKISPYCSLNGEFGYQLYDFKSTDTLFLKPKGFKCNLEFRLYISKYISKRTKSRESEFYLGIQTFYRQNQSTNSVSYSPKIDDSKYFTDTFGTLREVKGLNLIIGWQISISKKLIIEPFLGLGFQSKKIINTNIEYDSEKDIRGGTDLQPLFIGLNLAESSGSKFNFCNGLKLGYKL